MARLTGSRKRASPGPSETSTQPRGRRGVRKQAGSEEGSQGPQRGSPPPRDSPAPDEGEESDESEHESLQQDEDKEECDVALRPERYPSVAPTDVALRPARYLSLAPIGGAYSRGGDARSGSSEWTHKGKRGTTSELSDCEGDPEEQRAVQVSDKRIICTSVTASVIASVLVLVVGMALFSDFNKPTYVSPEKHPSTEPYPPSTPDEIQGYVDEKLASLNILKAEEVENIRNDLKHVKEITTSKLAGMDGRVEDFQKMWEDINQRLEELDRKLSGASDVQDKWKDINKRLEDLDHRLGEGASAETVSHLQKNFEDIKQRLEDLGNRLSHASAFSSQTVNDIRQHLEELDRRLSNGASAQTVSDMKQRLEELDRRLSGASDSGEKWGDIEQRLEELASNRYSVQYSLDKLQSEVGSLFVFKIISILSIVLGMAALVLVQRNRAAEVPPPPQTLPFLAANHHGWDQGKAVQAWTGTLERAVCVVHFSRDQHRLHMEQTRAVVPPGTKILEFTVNSHSDIPRVPGARLYLAFVNFNERNVILESPEQGTGDLRRTTVRTLQSRGADVVVVYVGDAGSARISPDQFYNSTYLKSVDTHPVLSQLRGRQRFFSIQDRFLEHQRLHLQRLVADALASSS